MYTIEEDLCMDLVIDNLFDGRKLRMLTVVDCYTRESLDIHVDQSFKDTRLDRQVHLLGMMRLRLYAHILGVPFRADAGDKRPKYLR